MQEYRTQVVIADDRYLCLKLPDRFPVGNAIVTVLIHTPESSTTSHDHDVDDDRTDIEWWEEFEGDRERVGERRT